MPKQVPTRNVIHLRLDARLHERLQQEADRHRFTLTNEIRARLLDSFDHDLVRGLENIRTNMEISWLKFAHRFLRMELGDQLADAVAANEDPDRIKALARAIIERRVIEQRPRRFGAGAL